MDYYNGDKQHLFSDFLRYNSLDIWLRYSCKGSSWLECTNPERWIMDAFDWCATIEGSSYWMRVHNNNWLETLRAGHVTTRFKATAQSYANGHSTWSTRAPKSEPKVSLWNRVKSLYTSIIQRYDQFIWRYQFNKVKYISLAKLDHCEFCHGKPTCSSTLCNCTPNEYLKLKTKKK